MIQLPVGARGCRISFLQLSPSRLPCGFPIKFPTHFTLILLSCSISNLLLFFLSLMHGHISPPPFSISFVCGFQGLSRLHLFFIPRFTGSRFFETVGCPSLIISNRPFTVFGPRSEHIHFVAIIASITQLPSWKIAQLSIPGP